MSKSKKDIYFIGDSFTYGHGCTHEEPHPYRQNYPPSSDDRLWVDIVADTLNGNLYNFGYNGASLETMLDCLIKYMHHMDSNDIVIISTGLVNRLDVWGPWFKFDNVDEDSIDKIIKRPFLLDLADNNHKQNNIISSERIKSIIEYISLNILPYEKYILENHIEKLYSIKRELEQRDIECFIWDWNDVQNFETIESATDGKINDGHFSWEGHRQFAKFFLKEYVNLEIYYNNI